MATPQAVTVSGRFAASGGATAIVSLVALANNAPPKVLACVLPSMSGEFLLPTCAVESCLPLGDVRACLVVTAYLLDANGIHVAASCYVAANGLQTSAGGLSVTCQVSWSTPIEDHAAAPVSSTLTAPTIKKALAALRAIEQLSGGCKISLPPPDEDWLWAESNDKMIW